MNYEEFKMQILDRVRAEFGSDTEVSLKPVRKNNGVVLDGLTIMPEGACIAPTIYINQYYRRYKEGLSVDAVVRIILKENEHYSINIPIDVDSFLKFDNLKEQIRFRLVNYAMNEEFLKDKPHVKVLDLAKVYYYEVQDSLLPSAYCTISCEDLERWGISEQELDGIADANMRLHEPPVVYSMREMLEMLSEGMHDTRNVREPAVPMFILTNRSRFFGASSILQEHAFKKFEGLLDGDLFVLPSSVHEVIVTPAEGGFTGYELERMVSDINGECVPGYEVLSDRVYLYDSEKDVIRLF